MTECNFFKKIQEEFSINSKTIEYRYNKFIEACNMQIDTDIAISYGENGLPYVNMYKNNEDGKYNIKFYTDYSYHYGINTLLTGVYNELNFMLVNNCKNDKRKKHINELPFYINLRSQNTYELEIEAESNACVKFVLRKYDEKVEQPRQLVFYGAVMEFGEVLRVVKAFVYDPKMVYLYYKDIVEKKKIFITNTDLINVSEEDMSLNEPVKGIKKLNRSIFK